MTDFIDQQFLGKIPEIFKVSKDDKLFRTVLAYIYASAPVNGINVRVIYNANFLERWSCRIQEQGIAEDPYVGQDNALELAARRLLAQVEQGADSKYLAVFNRKFLAIYGSQK